jgi:hypothetical protein
MFSKAHVAQTPTTKGAGNPLCAFRLAMLRMVDRTMGHSRCPMPPSTHPPRRLRRFGWGFWPCSPFPAPLLILWGWVFMDGGVVLDDGLAPARLAVELSVVVDARVPWRAAILALRRSGTGFAGCSASRLLVRRRRRFKVGRLLVPRVLGCSGPLAGIAALPFGTFREDPARLPGGRSATAAGRDSGLCLALVETSNSLPSSATRTPSGLWRKMGPAARALDQTRRVC